MNTSENTVLKLLKHVFLHTNKWIKLINIIQQLLISNLFPSCLTSYDLDGVEGSQIEINADGPVKTVSWKSICYNAVCSGMPL